MRSLFDPPHDGRKLSPTVDAFIATNGIRTHLPVQFPSETPENSGNIVHGLAPHNMFHNTMSVLDPSWRKLTPSGNFREFVNENCSHLIFTMANFFRVGDFSPTMRKRYDYFARALDGYDKPIVIFGMGSQAKSGQKLSGDALPEEGIRCLKKIVDKAQAISVRGDYTAELVRRVLGRETDNVFVTGCPSYFSKPDAFEKLSQALSGPADGSFAVNVTDYSRAADQRLVREAVRENYFLVEPANARVHQFHLDSLLAGESQKVPAELEFLAGFGAKVPEFFRSYYRLFRHFDSWIDFNTELVKGTVGTRFHANMASMLSGVPSVWVTHDERTRELTETLSLPSVDIKKAEKLTVPEILEKADFFGSLKAVPGNFKRFNEFLRAASLPEVTAPKN